MFWGFLATASGGPVAQFLSRPVVPSKQVKLDLWATHCGLELSVCFKAPQIVMQVG
jgi:hypothetical protein